MIDQPSALTLPDVMYLSPAGFSDVCAPGPLLTTLDPRQFKAAVQCTVCISSMHVTGMSTSQIVLALMMLRSLLMPARTNVKHAKPLLV